MHPQTRTQRPRWQLALSLTAAVLVVAVGCSRDPFTFDWTDVPDTVLLYSMARPELNLFSGFDFRQGIRVRIETPQSTGNWDVALDTRGGDLVLLPPTALGVDSRARVAALDGMSLDDVTEAPLDTLLYVADVPVPVRMGTVYVIKTHAQQGAFGSTCIYHGKMEAVDIDVANGALRFRHVTSPVCNSRDLVPPR